MAGKFFTEPGPDLADRVPPGQHLAKGFPVLTYGNTPQFSQADWALAITGMAEPKTFTWPSPKANLLPTFIVLPPGQSWM